MDEWCGDYVAHPSVRAQYLLLRADARLILALTLWMFCFSQGGQIFSWYLIMHKSYSDHYSLNTTFLLISMRLDHRQKYLAAHLVPYDYSVEAGSMRPCSSPCSKSVHGCSGPDD